eukprot:GHVN01058845.1.p1 GENE.GHVN01058845.1~~GHVN01058845.1.p1  ORF type:complete len:703 (-),score=90.83 GHVN01058845.1:4013-6001(-)
MQSEVIRMQHLNNEWSRDIDTTCRNLEAEGFQSVGANKLLKNLSLEQQELIREQQRAIEEVQHQTCDTEQHVETVQRKSREAFYASLSDPCVDKKNKATQRDQAKEMSRQAEILGRNRKSDLQGSRCHARTLGRWATNSVRDGGGSSVSALHNNLDWGHSMKSDEKSKYRPGAAEAVVLRAGYSEEPQLVEQMGKQIATHYPKVYPASSHPTGPMPLSQKSQHEKYRAWEREGRPTLGSLKQDLGEKELEGVAVEFDRHLIALKEKLRKQHEANQVEDNMTNEKLAEWDRQVEVGKAEFQRLVQERGELEKEAERVWLAREEERKKLKEAKRKDLEALERAQQEEKDRLSELQNALKLANARRDDTVDGQAEIERQATAILGDVTGPVFDRRASKGPSEGGDLAGRFNSIAQRLPSRRPSRRPSRSESRLRQTPPSSPDDFSGPQYSDLVSAGHFVGRCTDDQFAPICSSELASRLPRRMCLDKVTVKDDDHEVIERPDQLHARLKQLVSNSRLGLPDVVPTLHSLVLTCTTNMRHDLHAQVGQRSSAATETSFSPLMKQEYANTLMDVLPYYPHQLRTQLEAPRALLNLFQAAQLPDEMVSPLMELFTTMMAVDHEELQARLIASMAVVIVPRVSCRANDWDMTFHSVLLCSIHLISLRLF